MADRTKQLTSRTQKRQKVTRTEGNCLNKNVKFPAQKECEKVLCNKTKAEAKKNRKYL